MDNNYDNNSNNELRNTEENTPGVNPTSPVQPEQPVYSDPNAGAEAANQSGYTYGQTDNNSFAYGQNNNSEQNNNYQGYWDNQNQAAQPDQTSQYSQNAQYNYNAAQASSYNGDDGYDNTPMTMGDWLLVLLAALIPCCGGIVLYFVWAFSKKGNINRRNYCRAALIMQGAAIVIGLILWVIMGSAILSSMNYYYY